MGYIFLAFAILAEVFGTTMLKLSDGFSNVLPSFGIAIGFAVSFFFLGKALKTLPLSIAFSTWAGAGTSLTVAVGLVFFGESMNALQILGVMILITGVILINSSKGLKNTPKKSSWLTKGCSVNQ